MRAIMRQVRANLKSRKLQSALILLTLFAAATLLTVALSTLHTAQGAYERLFQRTQGAHLWLYLDPERVAAEEADLTLAGIPDVEATTGVIRSLSATLFVGEERLGGQRLREWWDETVTVGRPLLVAGRAPEPGETEAIVLDRNVAAAHHVQVGDTIDLLAPDGRRPLSVVGLFVSAEFCPYPYCFPPHNYLAPGALTHLGLSPPPAPEIESLKAGLRLRDPGDVKSVLHSAEERLPPQSIENWDDWELLRRFSDSSIENQRILLITFSAVAGLAAGFLIASTVGEAVRAQTRQIGLLKAVGFTRRQLASVYLLEVLGLALFASLAGLGAGGLIAATTLRSLALRFGETTVRPDLGMALVTPMSALFVCALFTLWPVRRAARMDAVEAIRVGAQRPRRRAARLPRALVSSKGEVGTALAVGLSDALSRPFRSLSMALGLGMAVLTLTAALTLNATLGAFVSDLSLAGVDGELFVYPSTYLADPEVRRLIAGQPDVAAHFGQTWWNFQFPGAEEILYARFQEGELAAFRFPLVEGRMFKASGEVVVGYGLARERGLGVGDALTILLEGQAFSLQVVGIYRETSNLGRMLMLPIETLRHVRPDVEPGRYVLKLRPGADPERVAAALVSASNDLLEVQVAGAGGLPDDVTAMRGVMTRLSLVLVGIAVIGVFNSVWIGVRERRRELGMLKAVGMTPGQVTFSVLSEAVGTALVGYVLGLAVGLVGIRVLIDTVARAVGFGPLNAPTDGVGLALLLPGIVLVAVSGAFLPAYRAGRTSVVDALRYE